jgi:hypothetical protein
MGKLTRLLANLRDYFRSVLLRRKRKKKAEDEDPFIYPHY